MTPIALFLLYSLVAPAAGGTLLTFPIAGSLAEADAEALKAIPVEIFDCEKHSLDHPGNIQLLHCKTCQTKMAKKDAATVERYSNIRVAKDKIDIISGACPGIALLRASKVEDALTARNVRLVRKGWKLRGHVIFDVGATPKSDFANLKRALEAFGRVEADKEALRVLLHFPEKGGPADHDAIVAAIEGAAWSVKDTLFIINQCQGKLVLPN
jgi:hypothetical protein